MGEKLQGPRLAVLLSAIVLAILVSACGSSSSDSPTGSTGGSAAPNEGNGSPPSLEKQGDPSSFIEPKNPNSKYAKFGSEASSAERAVAAEVLAENLEARESGDFATQCATLDLRANEEITKAKKPAEARSLCAGALKKLATPLKETEKFRVDTFGGQIAVFRVKGNTGYALYHGNDGNDWMMPMSKEVGVWKPGSISTVPVP